MGVPLHKHYPADETFHLDAIERMLATDMADGAAFDLYDELAQAGNSLLVKIGPVPAWNHELRVFKRRLEGFVKRYDATIDECRRLDNARLTP